MTITALPTPPSRQDPTNFAIRADSFLTALPIFATQANNLASTVNIDKLAAANSATSAAASLTAIANSATAAAAAAATSTTSATSAATSATSAATSATSAANSATSATNSATSAANSATSAGNSATSAGNSAISAATAATSATNSATSATTSATSATNSVNSFNRAYLGVKSVDPIVDNLGATLQTGATYWNSAVDELKIWDGSTWYTTQSIQASIDAAVSATAAATSALDAQATFDNFQNNYLGAKVSAPTMDNFGNSLQIGAVYWNSSVDILYIWDGSAWNTAATSITGAILSFNGRQGAVTLSRSDIESVIPFSPESINSTAVIRDTLGNFAANTISATDFNSTSDENLKTNIQPINTKDKFMELNPVQFTWKNSNEQSYGLIAQEVEKLFPELVIERADGFKGVSYIPIIAMLISKVQELSFKLEKLSQ